MKDIVIIANFCRDFSTTDNGRFMYLCKKLSQNNSVEIITSDFSHTEKKHKAPPETSWDFRITFLHESGYKKNISLKRFYSHFTWGRQVKEYLRRRKRPDVIYAAVPSLTAPLAAAKYCRKNGVRFIADVQDLWPEAFRMEFDIPFVSDLIFLPFTLMAEGIYKRADEICGVSKTYTKRAAAASRRKKTPHTVFLGTELKQFDRYAQENKVNKPSGELWLGYCGNLSSSYDITTVLQALARIKERGITPPKFIVMGDGERKADYEALAEKTGIDCRFTGALPYEQMCGMLCACDITVNPIVNGAAQSIINKHGDYAAAGLPVLNTQTSPEYRSLVREYKMGFNCKNGDPASLEKALLILMENEPLRTKMGRSARRCAEERFDRERTYKELIGVITEK